MAELMLLIGASAGVASTVGAIATIAAPVLAIGGALSNVQKGKEQKAEFQRAGVESRVAASVEAEKLRRRNRLSQSRDFAATAEGGALSGTGLGVLDQNAVQMELDALTVEFRGEQAGRSNDFRAAQTSTSYLPVFTAAVSGFNDIDPLNLTYGGQFTSARGAA